MPIHIAPEARLKCPHCLVGFKSAWTQTDLGNDADGNWTVWTTQCPACDRFVIRLREYALVPGRTIVPKFKTERMVWPKATSRNPVPPQVTKTLASDYLEACMVLPDSA